MKQLLKLITEKQIAENKHSEALMKLDACIDSHLNSLAKHNPDLIALEQAELAAAKAFKVAEEKLINYHPISAKEFGLQTSAIIGTFSDNDNDNDNAPYLTAVKRGAEALASGVLK